jgi:hypothetical protein
MTMQNQPSQESQQGQKTQKNQLFTVYNEMIQDNFETLRQLGEINMRAGERLFEQQLELTNTMIETGAKSMEMFSKARGYQEVLDTAKLGQEAGEQYMKTVRATVEVLADARDSATEVIEKQMESAKEKAREASESATQMMDEQMQKAKKNVQSATDEMKKTSQSASEEAKKGSDNMAEEMKKGSEAASEKLGSRK